MTLFVEPLDPRGVRVALMGEDRCIKEIECEHGDDLVAAAARIVRKKKPTRIVVRRGVGTFSASRASYVIATILGALWRVPVRFSDRTDAGDSAEQQFFYAAPPHISS